MLHRNRVRAESFGTVAELYDRRRPSYPPALADELLAGGVRTVLDVGCGTGIAAQLLAARGATVLGVEIDERMAAVARAKGLAVEVAPFERWEPAGRRFDLVIAAQAWHWIEPGAGLAKVASVLDPGGRFGLFWNFSDPPARIREPLAGVYERLEPDLAKASLGVGHRGRRIVEAGEQIEACGRFEPARTRTIAWGEPVSAAAWLEQLATHSDHQTLPAGRRERLLAAAAAALGALDEPFEIRYETVLVSARRNDSHALPRDV